MRAQSIIGFCALSLVLGIATHRSPGQACDITELYVKSFEMQETLQDNREVTRAAVTNTARGDYLIEFMVVGENGRERWTVTHSTDAQGVYTQRLDIDGNWQHTISYADAANDPRLSIAAPNLSAEVNVLTFCADTDRALFNALAVMTASNRRTVGQITRAIQNALQGPPPGFEDCWQGCPPYPPTPSPTVPDCTQLDPEVDCVPVHVCCVLQCQYTRCVAECWCDTAPNPPPDCCAQQETNYYACLNSCLESLVDCLQGKNCN